MSSKRIHQTRARLPGLIETAMGRGYRLATDRIIGEGLGRG
jgi:hypothetical protein